ncbi:hypothetical protein BSKO_01028 [Bryopsis sp. KO-2023]|nr:hypothetical protein BSKO_01028 [Bryopsis sp. KO-2023]
MLRHLISRGAKQGCALFPKASAAREGPTFLSRFASSDESDPQKGDWRKWIETKLPAESEGPDELPVESQGAPDQDPSSTTGETAVEDSGDVADPETEEAHQDDTSSTHTIDAFPRSSPIWEEQAADEARQMRLDFLSKALANEVKPDAVEEVVEEAAASSKPKAAMKPLADEATGYAELGLENTPEAVLDMPKLHPTRMFFSGGTYTPGDLSPMATSGGARRRGYQRNITEYTNEEAMLKADFKNLKFLNSFVTDSGRIMLRRETKLKARVHRHVMRQVKISRQMGLLPYQSRRAEFQRGRKQSDSTPVRMGNQVGQQRWPPTPQ